MSPSSKITQLAKHSVEAISPIESKIIEYLFEKKEATLDEITDELAKSKLTARSKSSISKKLILLEKEGLVIKLRKGRITQIKWVGGVPALESELQKATYSHMQASLLAENYDSLIVDPFSIFSLLFEGHCWEVIMNISPGLNDVELSKRIGTDLPLDSVRRVLVIAESHNLLTISTIREPAGDNFIKLFEPLYKIESINKEYQDLLIMIRGLASAISFRMEGNCSPDNSHLYDPLLESTIPMFLTLKDKSISNNNEDVNEILKNVICNYDFAPDMDRIYRHENWRKKLKNNKEVTIDKKTDHVLISKTLSEKYEIAIKKSVL